jgi:hypothetical protein
MLPSPHCQERDAEAVHHDITDPAFVLCFLDQRFPAALLNFHEPGRFRLCMSHLNAQVECRERDELVAVPEESDVVYRPQIVEPWGGGNLRTAEAS